jgi:hypothetical protein
MKKFIFAVILLSLFVPAVAFAEEAQKEEMAPQGLSASGAGGGMDMEKPMGMPGMEKMCRSMMGKAQMVATDEGGVIVLAGNKLMKYDADLNLVKEVEVKMPMPSMMGKQCPITGKMMDQGSASTAAGSQEKTA